MTRQPAHNEQAYKRYRAWLQANDVLCWRCGNRATSPDHDPPLDTHTHVRGSGCCVLRPACMPCQRRQGAELRNRKSSTGYSWPT